MKFLKKTALGLMLMMLGLFTACGSMSSEDVELLDSVLTTVIEVAEGNGMDGAAAASEESGVEENAAEPEGSGVEENAAESEEDPWPGIPEETLVEEDSDYAEDSIDEDGEYTSAEDVSLYLYLYGHLPENYITKKEARELGWDSSKGNLWEVAPGMSIGGDYFGNYEGLLPEEEDRDYNECDIDYEGGYRNSKRIIYSDDGLIFYTEDHYESFEQLY